MRSKVRLGSRTYLLASGRSILPVDHWTFGGITDSLENRGLSCVGPSNDEDSELDSAGELGENLLCSHSTKACQVEDESGS